MTYSLCIMCEKIYESDSDLLYDLAKPTRNNPTWSNNIVLKKKGNNTVLYHGIHEEENIMTREISSLFYQAFHDREEAIKVALDDAQSYNLR